MINQINQNSKPFALNLIADRIQCHTTDPHETNKCTKYQQLKKPNILLALGQLDCRERNWKTTQWQDYAVYWVLWITGKVDINRKCECAEPVGGGVKHAN